jgi:hypothetical protein
MAGSRAKRSALVPGHCEIPGCTWNYGVQKHRILPGRDGGKYVLGNVISLCPNHHYLADRDVISQDELYRIVVERIAQDATRHQGRAKPNTAEWLGFADESVSGNSVSWADVQDGNKFLYEGRCVISALEQTGQ